MKKQIVLVDMGLSLCRAIIVSTWPGVDCRLAQCQPCCHCGEAVGLGGYCIYTHVQDNGGILSVVTDLHLSNGKVQICVGSYLEASKAEQ